MLSQKFILIAGMMALLTAPSAFAQTVGSGRIHTPHVPIVQANSKTTSRYLIQEPASVVEQSPAAQPQTTHDHAQHVVGEPIVMDDCSCGQVDCQRGCRLRPVRCVRCPSCEEGVCELKTKEVKEEKKCFVVKDKKICIPAIRLPWQQCETKLGRTRTIKVLSTKKYECPKCEYKWEIVEAEKAEAGQPTEAKASTTRYQQAPIVPRASALPPIIRRTSSPSNSNR